MTASIGNSDCYTDRRIWADQFIAANRVALFTELAKLAKPEDDYKRGIDFEVRGAKVSARNRRIKYLREYPDEFTVRLGRPLLTNNSKGALVPVTPLRFPNSELRKILMGNVDLFLYGFGEFERLVSWKIFDFEVFRQWFNIHGYSDENNPGKLYQNRPDAEGAGTYFLAFDCKMLPDSFLVASGE